jgi:RNA polymerase sigma factor (sigma-70 family)
MSTIREELRAARSGDRAAMERLLAHFRPWLEQRATARFGGRGSDGDASDLVQEASLQAWLKLAQFRGHDDEEQELKMFHGWLAQIVHRVGQNRIRLRQAVRRRPGQSHISPYDGGICSTAAGPPASGQTASSAAAGIEAADDVRAAIAGLPDATDRLIIHEVFFEGHSLRDLADILQIDRETVRQQFHAVLASLRVQLQGHAG